MSTAAIHPLEFDVPATGFVAQQVAGRFLRVIAYSQSPDYEVEIDVDNGGFVRWPVGVTVQWPNAFNAIKVRNEPGAAAVASQCRLWVSQVPVIDTRILMGNEILPVATRGSLDTNAVTLTSGAGSIPANPNRKDLVIQNYSGYSVWISDLATLTAGSIAASDNAIKLINGESVGLGAVTNAVYIYSQQTAGTTYVHYAELD
jgi:hypothetical protein